MWSHSLTSYFNQMWCLMLDAGLLQLVLVGGGYFWDVSQKGSNTRTSYAYHLSEVHSFYVIKNGAENFSTMCWNYQKQISI